MKQIERMLHLAQELAVLGIAYETAREKLKILVAEGVPYTSEEMLSTLDECKTLQEQWFLKEQEYLLLRKQSRRS